MRRLPALRIRIAATRLLAIYQLHLQLYNSYINFCLEDVGITQACVVDDREINAEFLKLISSTY